MIFWLDIFDVCCWLFYYLNKFYNVVIYVIFGNFLNFEKFEWNLNKLFYEINFLYLIG